MFSSFPEITIIRSNRKTIGLQINEDLTVTVRAPYRMSDRAVQRFVREKSPWIEKHMRKIQKSLQEAEAEKETEQPITAEEIKSLTEQARRYIPERTSYYASILNVSYGRISIRCQKSRWGSCSSKGNLNFNCLLMLTPPEIIDYVIVHELCHRIWMNHSERFWREVENVLPDYGQRREWLRKKGNKIMRRVVRS